MLLSLQKDLSEVIDAGIMMLVGMLSTHFFRAETIANIFRQGAYTDVACLAILGSILHTEELGTAQKDEIQKAFASLQKRAPHISLETIFDARTAEMLQEETYSLDHE